MDKKLVEEIKKLVTKKEFRLALKKLATKEELKKLATKEELAQLEKILREEIRLTARETKEEIGEKILESESRVLGTLDAFLVEIETSRQERTITAHQDERNRETVEDHGRRIGVLEEKVFASI